MQELVRELQVPHFRFFGDAYNMLHEIPLFEAPMRVYDCHAGPYGCSVPTGLYTFPYCAKHLNENMGLRLGVSSIPEVASNIGCHYGLFATRPFRSGDVICQMLSECVSLDVINSRYGGTDAFTAPFGITDENGRIYDGALIRSPGCMANHASASDLIGPNAVLVCDVWPTLVADHDIHEGAEITWDYGSDYDFNSAYYDVIYK